MKRFKNFKMQIPLLVIILVFSQCAKEDEELGNFNNPDASSIDEQIGQFSDWVDKTIPMEWDSVLAPVNVEDTLGIPSSCGVIRRAMSISTDEIISVGTNFGKIWPGAILEGNSLESGDLKLINIDRSGITINTNLPINQTFREIENPNSVSLQQAISEMQIEAGSMPDGVRASAGQVETKFEEYSAFLQAMLSMGINGGFAEPQSKIKLSGEAGGSLEFKFNTHSIIAKFVQKAFTIRLADDLLDSPSDFFANTVSLDDIKKLESSGVMSSNNVPLYIESVTYGRFLLFTLTSTNVESAAKLNAAIGASWDQYANAGAELSAEYKAALASKSVEIFSAGGTEEGANAIASSLDWGKFFVEAPVTTAVPISFVARTLNGKKQVILIDNTVFNQRGECDVPVKIKLKIDLANVTLTSPTIGTAQYACGALRDGAIVDFNMESGEFITGLKKNTNKVKLFGSSTRTYEWDISTSSSDLNKLTMVFRNNLIQKPNVFNYPFSDLEQGINKRSYPVTNNKGEKMVFEYSITKAFE